MTYQNYKPYQRHDLETLLIKPEYYDVDSLEYMLTFNMDGKPYWHGFPPLVVLEFCNMYCYIVKNEYGTEFDLRDTEPYMNADIAETVHRRHCSPQEFFNAYASAHEEAFGEPWLFTQENPVY